MQLNEIEEWWLAHEVGYEAFCECLDERGLNTYVVMSILEDVYDGILEKLVDDCGNIGMYVAYPELFEDELKFIELPKWLF